MEHGDSRQISKSEKAGQVCLQAWKKVVTKVESVKHGTGAAYNDKRHKWQGLYNNLKLSAKVVSQVHSKTISNAKRIWWEYLIRKKLSNTDSNRWTLNSAFWEAKMFPPMCNTRKNGHPPNHTINIKQQISCARFIITE